MVRKIYLVLCLAFLLAAGIFAKDNQWQLGLGFREIGDEYYGSLSFRPDLNLGKIGLGLSIGINFNQNGLRTDDWQEKGQFSFAKTVASIIRYVRWGRLGDPFYLRLGELDNVIVGNGLIMDGYRNLSSEEIKADLRRLGVEIGGDIGIVGAHLLVNNALNPEVFSLRPYVRPFYLVDAMPQFIQNSSVGVIYARDTRELSKMPYAYGLDLTIPLLNYLAVYGQTAELANNSRGYSIGMRSYLGPLYIRGEYRIFSNSFIPAVYNWEYENKDTTLKYLNEKAEGYLAEAGVTLLDEGLKLHLQYENMIFSNRDPVPTLTGTAAVTPSLFTSLTGRKGQIEASYSQINYVKVDELANSNTKIDAKFSIEIYKGLMGSYIYKVTFNPDKTPVRFQAFEVSLGGSF